MIRREFLGSVVAAATGTFLSGITSPAAERKPDDLKIAIIGVGRQGKTLLNAAKEMPGVRFKALCDIWEYARHHGQRWLKKYGHEANAYEDYREMLQSEGDLDAVIIASPDFVHAEQANAALRAGKHVYCEAPMSNDVTQARSIVRTMRETGRLCQIGHQRRSNPRYIHAFEKLLGEAKLCGRMAAINCQSGPACAFYEKWGWPDGYAMSADSLAKYGYGTMSEFRNWPWFRKFGSGPFGHIGIHQMDVCDWFLGARPTAVMGSGAPAEYPGSDVCSNVMAICEFDTRGGKVRASLQIVTTASGGGYFEQFLGNEGNIKISQMPDETSVYRDLRAPAWEQWIALGYLRRDPPPPPSAMVIRETFNIPVVLDKPWHTPHLENFFDAIRGRVRLNCPADQAYRTTVATLKVGEAISTKRAITFDSAEFEI